MATLCIFVLLLLYGSFVFVQSNQVYAAASAQTYAMYRPVGEDGGLSFGALREINPDVFAWLTIYGTNVDYPVARAEDNDTYVNTNIMGEYSISGSLFLDYECEQNFSGFTSIIYGHYMEKSAMFGGLGGYLDAGYLDTHPYGNIFFGGEDHGVEFFAFLEVDAYDGSVYAPVVSAGQESGYVDNLYAKSMYSREVDITAQSRIVLLSTCTPTSTNGRYILAGKITDATYDNPYQTDKDVQPAGNRVAGVQSAGFLSQISWWSIAPPSILILLIICYILITRSKRRGENHKARHTK